MRLKDKVAIVTGASQGFGQILAQAVAGEGAMTVLAARSEKNLADTSKAIADAGNTVETLVVWWSIRRRPES